MAWRGFLKESKSFMNYPHCGRLKFWLEFPKAFIIYWLTIMRGKRRSNS